MLLIIRGLARAGPAYGKERSREDMDQLPAGTSSAALLSRALDFLLALKDEDS